MKQELGDVLQEALQEERIHTDGELHLALLNQSVDYFNRRPGASDEQRQSSYWTYHPRARMYILDKVFWWLHKNTPPGSVVEIGSAGDICMAMLFPETEVTSLDVDPNIFLNVPYNQLPEGLFRRIGQKKNIEYYGPDNFLGRKYRKLDLVKRCLPNFKVEIADAENIPYQDNQFDAGLIQGTPDLVAYLDEATRVVKPGAYIVALIDEANKMGEHQSFYTSGKYNDQVYKELGFASQEQSRLDALDLERVIIPQHLRDYEHLATWINDQGEVCSAGVVFEIFHKRVELSKSS